MNFREKKPIHLILESLFKTYSNRVPDVKKITNGLVKNKIISNQEDIINDHIAFRTMGVKNLGINSFEKIFLHHGYVCLLYTSPSPRDATLSRMPSSA